MEPITAVWALTALGMVSVTVYFLLQVLLPPQPMGQRELHDLLGMSDGETLDMGARPDPVPILSRLLARMQVNRDLQVAIVRAGWPLRPAELVTISLLGAAIGWTVGYLVYGGVGAAAGALLLTASPWVLLSGAQARRQRALMLQLPDTIDLICASLRAGHGFAAALKNVREQGRPPLAVEAGRVVDELGLGLSLGQALDRMMMRTGQDDIALVCTAVQVQTRTGGNLAEVLATLGDVIRERIQLAGEISALAAEGQLSAMVLIALPPIMAVVLHSMSPGWLDPLVTDPLGNLMLGAGVLAFLIGIYLMHRLVQIDL